MHHLTPCRGREPRLLSWAAVIREWVGSRPWKDSWVCCCHHMAHPWVQGKSAFRSYFWDCNYVLFCFVFRYKRQSWATCSHLLWPVGHWQEQNSETGQPASALIWLEWCPPQPRRACEDCARTCTHIHTFVCTHTHTHTHTHWHAYAHTYTHMCTHACTIRVQ